MKFASSTQSSGQDTAHAINKNEINKTVKQVVESVYSGS